VTRVHPGEGTSGGDVTLQFRCCKHLTLSWQASSGALGCFFDPGADAVLKQGADSGRISELGTVGKI